jgi:putative ABC transport system ATP-binding protein
MIETLGLRYGYPGGAGLRFADVRIEQGGTLLLRGPSGSGKSTWLALAAGLLTATEGEMIVAGQPLRPLGGRARDAWRAGAIGLLPQKLYLSDALSVAGNLALVYYAAGLPVDHDAIARTLDALGVGELARRLPAQLSGGQAQRVALARAVLRAPTRDPGRRAHGQSGRRGVCVGAGPAAPERSILRRDAGGRHARPPGGRGAAAGR